LLERSEEEWVRLGEEKIKAQVVPLEKPHVRGRPNRGIDAAVRELGISLHQNRPCSQQIK
jgi:hypothetical protein